LFERAPQEARVVGKRFVRVGVLMAPTIIEDRRRAEVRQRTEGLLMIARADGEPLHVIFEGSRFAAPLPAIASCVKVTVEEGGAHKAVGSSCDLQAGVRYMPLNLEDKKALVQEVSAVAAKASSVVAAEYRGITVSQMTDLRAKARGQGVYMRVVKNTLARKALAGTSFEPIGPKLKGPLVLAFSKDDPGAAARVVKDFAKANDKLVPTLVSLGGQVLSPKDIDKVASLPTKEQAIAQLLGLLKAPIQKLVRTLAEPQAKLVRTVAAVRDQKQAAGV
jgi:large subunit ribosomal protein L10